MPVIERGMFVYNGYFTGKYMFIGNDAFVENSLSFQMPVTESCEFVKTDDS